MEKNFLETLKNRRSIYALSDEMIVSDDKIIEIVRDAVKYTPTPFNNQSPRAVVLFGENHKKLWNIVMETLRKIVPAANFKATEEKISNCFACGYGSILFFDDTKTTKEMMEKFPIYADNFPVWAEQSNGMVQLAIWAMLEEIGLGASLQHYNPIIDDEVKEVFNIPQEWKLIAQMPFGKPLAPAGEKDFMPIHQRVLVL